MLLKEIPGSLNLYSSWTFDVVKEPLGDHIMLPGSCTWLYRAKKIYFFKNKALVIGVEPLLVKDCRCVDQEGSV